MDQKIKHLVIFSLKYDLNSKEAMEFLKDAKEMLSQIPVVHDLEILKEISHKNEYQYGFAMEFSNQKDYQFYLEHPFHVQFIKNDWKQAVTDYLEMNFQVN